MVKKDLYYIAVIIAALVIAFYFYDQDQKHIAESLRKDSALAEKDAVIAYHVTDKGRIIAEKDAAQLTTKEFLEFYKADSKRMSEEFDIRTKNIKAYFRAEFVANGSGKATIINNTIYDSTKSKRVVVQDLTFTDTYLSFSSRLFPGMLTAESIYNYSDTLIHAFHTKKKWLLGNEKLYGSSMLSNPKAKVINSTSVLLNQYRDKRWVVYAGISYSPFTEQKVVPTVGVGYALYKF